MVIVMKGAYEETIEWIFDELMNKEKYSFLLELDGVGWNGSEEERATWTLLGAEGQWSGAVGTL